MSFFHKRLLFGVVSFLVLSIIYFCFFEISPIWDEANHLQTSLNILDSFRDPKTPCFEQLDPYYPPLIPGLTAFIYSITGIHSYAVTIIVIMTIFTFILALAYDLFMDSFHLGIFEPYCRDFIVINMSDGLEAMCDKGKGRRACKSG